MKTYSISEAVEELEVDRKTLRRWIRKKVIPEPVPGMKDGHLCKLWTEKEMAGIRKYAHTGYWGLGINRKTGKKARQKEN